jgi:plastocyanin
MSGVNRLGQSRRGILRRLAALAVLPFARPALAQEAGLVTVEMTKFAFTPAAATIRAGGSVVFVNRDLAPHTATAQGHSFETGTLRKDERKEIVFPAAGEFPYFCRFHRHMTGIIRVA